MAYETRHTAELQSHGGIFWKLSIIQNNTTGTALVPSELTLFGPDGFVLSYEGQAEEITQDVIGSELSFNVTGSDAVMQSLASAIVSASETDFFVKVERSDDAGSTYALWWGGMITNEITEIPDTGQYVIGISAVDGLAYLEVYEKNLSEIESAFTQPPVVSFFELVHYLLSAIPWAAEVIGTGNLYKHVQNVYPVGASGLSTFWDEEVSIDLRVFATYNDKTEEYELKNYFEILQILLQTWGLELFLNEGIFTIRSKTYLSTQTRRYQLYNNAGAVGTNLTENTDIIIDQSPTQVRLAGGKFYGKRPVKKVTKKITFQTSALDDPETLWDTVNNYSVGTTGLVQIDTISSDDTERLVFDYNVPVTATKTTGLFYNTAFIGLYITVKAVNAAGTRYAAGDVVTGFSWSASAQQIYIRSLPLQHVNYGAPVSSQFWSGYFQDTFELVLPFTSGVTELFVEVEFANALNGGNNGSWTPATLNVFLNQANFKIKPVDYNGDSHSGYTTFSAVSSLGNGRNLELPDGILHDELYWDNRGNLVLPTDFTSKWQFGGAGTQYYLPEMVCLMFLNYLREPLKLYSGSIICPDLNFNSRIRIEFDGVNEFYCFNGGRFAAKADKWAGEFWLVREGTAGTISLSGLAPLQNRRPPTNSPNSFLLNTGTTSGWNKHFNIADFVAEWKEQNQNQHLSSPSGSRGYPVFRWLDREDMRRAGISFREYNEDTVLTKEAVEKYDVFILNNTSGTTMAVTIPDAADYDYQPRPLYFKRFDTDVYRVAIKAGTQLIDGQSEWELKEYECLCVAYDGENQATYHIISQYKR